MLKRGGKKYLVFLQMVKGANQMAKIQKYMRQMFIILYKEHEWTIEMIAKQFR